MAKSKRSTSLVKNFGNKMNKRLYQTTVRSMYPKKKK